jgi:hypothetical protein
MSNIVKTKKELQPKREAKMTQTKLRDHFGSKLWDARRDALPGEQAMLPVMPSDSACVRSTSSKDSIFDCEMVHALKRTFDSPKAAMTRMFAYVVIDGVVVRFIADSVARNITVRRDIANEGGTIGGKPVDPAIKTTTYVRIKSPLTVKYQALGSKSRRKLLKDWAKGAGKPIVVANDARRLVERLAKVVETKQARLADSPRGEVTTLRAAIKNDKIALSQARDKFERLEAKVAHRRHGPQTPFGRLPEGTYDRKLVRRASGRLAA